MRLSALSPILSCAAVATAAAITNETTPEPTIPNVVQSTWDGKCFYPTPDAAFDLEAYLGRWYQVAGTVAPFTAGCKCIFAQYSLNDNGTVKVNNTCEAGDRAINILGTAAPADPSYGAKGVLRVQFPGQPGPACAGPNYVVQDYTPDFALVQSNNFTTLFVLSRQQNPEEAVLDAWIARAGQLGSNLDDVVKTDQTDCKFT
ncbi:lipocalin-like domain-containing protein [Colletotrichum tofieldiae]|uniref:Lipocalin-like domain-containing protein n=1 Tax=Colletotrichum tofieldiae TaxID=708197 RepID=A0A166Y9T6_9PEZI|nr:lipocalin-like domain-containing protein [Colletotrichum tofieldiae]GKT58240.1 lipocalin-like domain-containing protein [Colletotrichum tofieldiae]GKT79744.1 lipocalin-like domain-containing protein [Colletotrichum tofieldiae]GKT84317.1 lipocalin-like domain-containing protein [Colletotrichum tofieldiae]